MTRTELEKAGDVTREIAGASIVATFALEKLQAAKQDATAWRTEYNAAMARLRRLKEGRTDE